MVVQESKAEILSSLQDKIDNYQHGSLVEGHVDNSPLSFLDDVEQREKTACGEKNLSTISQSRSSRESSCDEKKAYQKILQILSHRDRTEHELRVKLATIGFEEHAIDEALDHALRLGLIDDMRFCSNYIEQLYHAGKGKRTAINDLKRKGIPQHCIEQCLEKSSYAEEDEESRALTYLEAHKPRGKNLRDSAFRKLVSKGYSIEASSKASSTYCKQQEQSE